VTTTSRLTRFLRATHEICARHNDVATEKSEISWSNSLAFSINHHHEPVGLDPIFVPLGSFLNPPLNGIRIVGKTKLLMAAALL